MAIFLTEQPVEVPGHHKKPIEIQKDLSGQQVEFIKFVKPSGVLNGKYRIYWWAICLNCFDPNTGSPPIQFLVNPDAVRDGRTVSCGCVRAERFVEHYEKTIQLMVEGSKRKKARIEALVKTFPDEFRQWAEKAGEGDVILGISRLLRWLRKDIPKSDKIPKRYIKKKNTKINYNKLKKI